MQRMAAPLGEQDNWATDRPVKVSGSMDDGLTDVAGLVATENESKVSFEKSADVFAGAMAARVCQHKEREKVCLIEGQISVTYHQTTHIKVHHQYSA
jgi:hypothetical protein